jgi:glycyl-tRNA synthetase
MNEPQFRPNTRVQSSDRLQSIVAYCKRHGFVVQSSEIYGGFQAAYDYGPRGVLLFENLKALWRTEIRQKHPNVIEMDGAIMSHPKVWEASGHLDRFNDLLVEDLETHERHRADKLVEEALGIDASAMPLEEIQQLITANQLRSPKGNALSEVKSFNLMVEARVGSTRQSSQTVYLRGETCQTIFPNFAYLQQAMRQSIPFGVLQIGKAFRNEITTKQFILRTREFDQMEFEFFIDPEDSFDWYSHWGVIFTDLLVEHCGIPRDRVRLRTLPPAEMSHYAKMQADFEIQLTRGDWLEVSPLNHRGDWDLRRHADFSGKDLTYFDQRKRRRYIPNVIETSFGLARLLYCLIDLFLVEEKLPTGDARSVLRLAPKLAPTTVAVLPLRKDEALVDFAEKIFRDLARTFATDLDLTGSIGKRYRRQDEVGTPFCVTIDETTLQDSTVTVRHRDTMKQERCAATSLMLSSPR